MNYFKTGFCSLAVVFTFAACHSPDDSREAIRHAQRSTEQARQQALNMDKIDKDVLKAIMESKEIMSSGGQPGTVKISGALVTDVAKGAEGFDPRISLDIQTGKGWNGTQPDLDKEKVIAVKELTQEQLTQIDKIESGKFINLGCDLDNFETDDLVETELPPIDVSDGTPVQVISAELVLICDGTKLRLPYVSVAAKKLVLSSLKVKMTGMGLLSILADSLVLEGETSLELLGTDGDNTFLPGPGLWIAVKSLDGDGTIKALSKGSSYIEKKKETTP